MCLFPDHFQFQAGLLFPNRLAPAVRVFMIVSRDLLLLWIDGFWKILNPTLCRGHCGRHHAEHNKLEKVFLCEQILIPLSSMILPWEVRVSQSSSRIEKE